MLPGIHEFAIALHDALWEDEFHANRFIPAASLRPRFRRPESLTADA